MDSQVNRPLVSVITPTFNRADFVGECIESVLGQTYPNLEHLLVDDGSTDNTQEIVERYLPDQRLRFARQANSGQATARNMGLGMARGEYICFLDSDNVWKLDKIERQLKLMQQHPAVDVIYGNQEVIDEDGNILPMPEHKRMKRYSGRITDKLLLDNFVSFNTAMIRRRCFDKVKGFDQSVRAGDDYDLWLRFSAHFEFLHVPEIFGQYRVMKNQISTDKERRFNSNKAMLERFIAAHPELVDEAQQRFVWSRFHVRRGRTRASAGRKADAFNDYLTALRLKPFSAAPWRALARLTILRK